MVEMRFHVSGKGHVGGEGFAFWYTKDRGLPKQLADAKPGESLALDPSGLTLGPVYGSTDQWTGLGIIFDTYDEVTNRVSE